MLVRFLVQEGDLRTDPTARVSAPGFSGCSPPPSRPSRSTPCCGPSCPRERPLRPGGSTRYRPAGGALRRGRADLRGARTQDGGPPPDHASVRLHGKGDKMRVVPLGRRARAALQNWIDVHRPRLLRSSPSGGRPEAAIFLSAGPAPRPPERVAPRQGGRAARGSPGDLAPRPAPFFRHPHAGRRSRPARGAGDARPRIDPDDGDLHPPRRGARARRAPDASPPRVTPDQRSSTTGSLNSAVLPTWAPSPNTPESGRSATRTGSSATPPTVMLMRS